MSEQAIFHAGERAVQRKLGVFDDLAPWAQKIVRPFLPEQHRVFYAELPFLVAAARDQEGRPWATLLVGRPGFARSPDPLHLRIDSRPVPGDALEHALVPGVELGLLGIELESRRRNRVNGRVSGADAEGFDLEVGQSFGNCPQYIRERRWSWATHSAEASHFERSRTLTPSMRARIERADTFFIATGHPGRDGEASHGMDASHRGGAPGFVKVEGGQRLIFPDYAGNNHFNTIGNLVVDDRVGLSFVDFEDGGLLQLTGRATIDWDSPEVAHHHGAKRLIAIELDEVVELRKALPLRWGAAPEAFRALRLIRKTRESVDVCSFTFEASDGRPLPDFEPGQHLAIALDVPDASEPVRRTYSLSNAPGEGVYRISVKREPHGIASGFLHDDLEEGAVVHARTPAGEFFLPQGATPVALISAGIGVTPTVSMLRDVVARSPRRKLVFVHVARDGRHHALAAEVRRLVSAGADIESHVFYSRPTAEDRIGHDFDEAGRPDANRLAALLPEDDTDVYLCGPVGFMASVQQGLEGRGIAPERIHTESFGPRG
jgi:hypothetical protein